MGLKTSDAPNKWRAGEPRSWKLASGDSSSSGCQIRRVQDWAGEAYAVSANVSPAPPRIGADNLRRTSFRPSQEQIVLLITILLLVVSGAAVPGFARVA